MTLLGGPQPRTFSPDTFTTRGSLKAGIHPQYTDSRIICACGNVIETRSTLPEIHVEICSQCHPYYTGKQKFTDTAGRIEKFRARYSKGAKSTAGA